MPPSISKVDRVVQSVLARIESGELLPGHKLRSLNDEAIANGVAKNTVVEAYLRLVAQGVLQSKHGSGYYVARAVPRSRPSAILPFEGITDGEALLTEQLERRLTVRPGDGRLPPDWLEESKLKNHLSSIRLLSSEAYNYNSAWGYLPLRERLCGALAERGISASPDRLLMTQGANHAMDLVIRGYVNPGDAVLVDEPGYYPLFSKLKLARARIVGVKRDQDGPCLDDLSEKARSSGARIFFTQSLAHNPTGGSITLGKAYGVLRIAEANNLMIVEDDPFADILPFSLPRLASLDQLERVIYIGSFSKTLAGSFRVGYVAASKSVTSELCRLLVATIVSTSSYNERLIFALIDQGHYLRHLRVLRARVTEATQQSINALKSVGLDGCRPFGGGFYLWVSTPEKLVDARAVAHAAARGILIAPSMAFVTQPSDMAAMRVNVAHGHNPQFISWLSDYLSKCAT
ncbi:PLP-dependent aminotransferase family protein [Noviherbaspirillum sedimenti]|uniref:PLP-dependent aminotransferase family protein n=1 Tax=Noviherbaspirillum sedimenti TaxID=2320865 RepID=A0A3A3GHQ1_9BURK|nr:PLP-dependent aminotransferase family protein [Noviherbaspirillum sedimenti]RJG00430.1 PLP-dependent aminotransferase family protein [Noviherbaspirillum sedimenti]